MDKCSCPEFKFQFWKSQEKILHINLETVHNKVSVILLKTEQKII